MPSSVRNQIQAVQKEVSALTKVVRRQSERVREAALYSLSDRQLKALAASDPDPEAVSAYRSVLEAVALRTGWPCPSGELPVEAMARELVVRSRSGLSTLFPDEGEFRRELYPKQLEFFLAGRDHREVALIAGNRCGKSEAGAYQTALHLTGRYPEWWEGRRFAGPVNVWMMSDTNQTTRDILQTKLMGRLLAGQREVPGQALGLGTGMLPRNAIQHTRPKSALPGAIDFAQIRHVSGGRSTVTFKSYEQGREAFQGTAQDLIVCDEEPPRGVYMEALMRTMATGGFEGGLMMLLFTPLSGWSEVVQMFLNREEREKADRYCVQAGWDDVPHLAPAEKTSMLAAYRPYERDARSKGIPQLGSGAIYPLAESSIWSDPFKIPAHWPRIFGMDPGWNWTAALWLAQDPESRCLYAYAEHYFSHCEPSENARAVLKKGPWIPGVIDPAANSRSQADGTQLMIKYRDLGLQLRPAKNAVDAGLMSVWELLQNNELKIFKSLANFWGEFRLYRKNEKGRVVKENDHLMDCLRYAVMSRAQMITEPVKSRPVASKSIYTERGWMA